MYRLEFLTEAKKYFKKLKEQKLKDAYKSALEKLSENPYIGEAKIGDLAGLHCYDVYYNGKNYEIAYKIYEQADKLVVVILAGTRQNFYEQLKRYIR